MDDGRARDLRAPVPFFNIDEVDDQRLAHKSLLLQCNKTHSKVIFISLTPKIHKSPNW